MKHIGIPSITCAMVSAVLLLGGEGRAADIVEEEALYGNAIEFDPPRKGRKAPDMYFFIWPRLGQAESDGLLPLVSAPGVLDIDCTVGAFMNGQGVKGVKAMARVELQILATDIETRVAEVEFRTGNDGLARRQLEFEPSDFTGPYDPSLESHLEAIFDFTRGRQVTSLSVQCVYSTRYEAMAADESAGRKQAPP